MKTISNITFLLCILGSILLTPACKKTIESRWTVLDHPGAEVMQDIQFINADTGFVVGGIRWEADRILYTSDGGESWQSPAPIFGQTLFGLNFKDGQTGFAAGISGKILRTENGGKDWHLSQIHSWQTMYAIQVVNDSVLIALGGRGYGEGEIVRSSDAGKTWQLVDTFSFELRSLYFTDEKTGYASGYGVILKTTDAGKSWNFTSAEGDFFIALSFPTADIGYAAGRNGSLLKTTDAGKSWKTLRSGSALGRATHFYNDIAFWDKDTGYLLGDKGLMLKTTDGGKRWTKVETTVQSDLQGISLIEKDKGFVCGNEGLIMRFED